MGTEAAWVPLVMAAVSGGAQYYNARQQTKKQDKILSQQLIGNDRRQKEADKKTSGLLERAAGSTMADEKQGRLGDYLTQLAQAMPQSQGGLSGMPRGGSAHQADAEAAALGIQQTGNTYADRVATIDGAGLQRQGEQVGRNRHSTQDMAMINREQEGADRMTGLRLDGVRSNPWLEALAAAAGAYGSNYSGGKGAKAKAPPADMVPAGYGGRAVYGTGGYRV